MHGLLIGLGTHKLDIDKAESAWLNCSRASINYTSIPDAFLMHLRPKNDPVDPVMFETISGIKVIVDGYILMRDVPPSATQTAHRQAFAACVAENNLQKALEQIVAGSYDIVVLDEKAGHYSVISDPFASIPLYYANVPDACLFSTNPLALARLDGIDRSLDLTAQASWTLIGYTIGQRYFLKGIRIFPPARILQWNCASGTSTFHPGPVDPYSLLPKHTISTEELCSEFQNACARLNKMNTPTAHLQSAGMDSRLIIAAWPSKDTPPSYVYGKPGSVEVAVAKKVAELSNSRFIHSAPSGDDVAEVTEDIFESNGLIVYPDRYLIAQRMAIDGWKRVLDGFAGDVLIGGTYYESIKRFFKCGMLHRLSIKFHDHDIAKFRLDEIAEKIYTDICQIPDPSTLKGFVSLDWIRMLKKAKIDILEDIYHELLRLRPKNDSLSILYRNFLMANRLIHAIVQQGVMCRQFVNVAYPFTNDFDFLQLILKARPEIVADRHFYIKLYRRHYPRYAAIPWGISQLPLKRSPFSHKLSEKMIKNGLFVPGLTGNFGGRSLSENNWQRWLYESASLREELIRGFDIGGIASANIKHTMMMIENGEKRGNGKLMHLSAIGRWSRLAN